MNKLHHSLITTLFAALVLSGCSASSNLSRQTDAITNQQQGQALFAQAQLAAQREDYGKALLLYIEALNLKPDDAPTLYNIGQMHMYLGNSKLAERAFKQTLRLAPDHIGALAQLGIWQLKERNSAEAESTLTRAVVLDQQRLHQSEPDTWVTLDAQSPVMAYNALAVLYDVRGQHQQARDLLQLALAQTPDSALLLSNLGYSFYLDGNFPQASQYYQQAINSQPDFHRAWANLGLVNIRQGQYSRALQNFKQVMPEEQAYNDLGYFLKLEGRYEEASYFLQQAIEKSPKYYELAQENLADVRMNLASVGIH